MSRKRPLVTAAMLLLGLLALAAWGLAVAVIAYLLGWGWAPAS